MVVSIQYLRGIAAMLVVFQHVARKAGQYADDPLAWFRVGGAGVDIFFIISGFIMCHTTSGATGSPARVIDFLKRRAIRILPLYWLLSLVALAAMFIKPELVNSAGAETRIFESFLLLPVQGVYLIANGWTLSYEFFFYFIFAIGMLFEEKIGRALSAALLGLLVTLGTLISFGTPAMRFCTDPMLAEFILGMGLYHFHRRCPRLPTAIAGIFIIAGALLLRQANAAPVTSIRVIDYGLPAILMCTGLVGLEPVIRARKINALESLGDISYSLYLVHPFALSFVSLVFQKAHLLKPGWTWIFPAALAASSVLAGWLCYEFIEKPLGTLAKRILTGRPTKVTAPHSEAMALQAESR